MGSAPSLTVTLEVARSREVVVVERPLGVPSIETTSSVAKAIVTEQEIDDVPLAGRSFANMAYLAPMTEPVEPSDPTKARITAVSFAGSSGLNVDLSVAGGDNNDGYIGGFLQKFSPDAIGEFVVRTAQFDADTSRTNGGSILVVTRHGTDIWHGGVALFERAAGLNARNPLDNPEPNPKAPFSRKNALLEAGGPLRPKNLWLFSSLEFVRENASVPYGANSIQATTDPRARMFDTGLWWQAFGPCRAVSRSPRTARRKERGHSRSRRRWMSTGRASRRQTVPP